MKIAHIEWEKKPRTLGKVQKIKDLEGVGLFHPFKNTRYMIFTKVITSNKQAKRPTSSKKLYFRT